MRLGTRCEGGDLPVPDVDPLHLALTPQRVGQPVQAVADDAVDPLHTRCREGFGELIGNGLHDLAPCARRCISLAASATVTAASTNRKFMRMLLQAKKMRDRWQALPVPSAYARAAHRGDVAAQSAKREDDLAANA